MEAGRKNLSGLSWANTQCRHHFGNTADCDRINERCFDGNVPAEKIDEEHVVDGAAVRDCLRRFGGLPLLCRQVLELTCESKGRDLMQRVILLAIVTLLALPLVGLAEDKTVKIQGAGGAVSMDVPDTWKAQQPKVRIIEHEYSIPAAEGDTTNGRLTMMAAGGSVKDNVNRWIGQFDPAGLKKDIKDVEVKGLKVHKIKLGGTYNDRRGPFAPATKKSDYLMLGAIIEMKSGGLYFVKFYGPEKTVAANEKGFEGLLQSLESK